MYMILADISDSCSTYSFQGSIVMSTTQACVSSTNVWGWSTEKEIWKA